jgi:signal transduction histidine kinase/ABC-type nitrate/sulfonate/bicarbonate transport system substrate-binding protein/ActR/RegA family two-component response regulator
MERVLLIWCCLLALWGSEQAESVQLQLPRNHQFQFAGYYAAVDLGYFVDEGLSVTIGELGAVNAGEIDDGRAQFAIYDSRILGDWARGRDIALVAIILQRSPQACFVHQDGPYQNLSDLLANPEARIVGPQNGPDPELAFALTALGKDPSSIFPRNRSSGDLEAFANRELDLLPGTLVDDPYHLKERNVEIRQVRYQSDGRSSFFGDILVTQGQLLRNRPDLVSRFRRATLRGWLWALDHRSQAVDLVLSHWQGTNPTTNRAELLNEAQIIEHLIDRSVIELGSINLPRLESLAESLRSVGMPGLVRRDLIWRQPDPSSSWVRVLAWCLGLAAAACGILFAITWATRRRLRGATLSQQLIMDLAESFFLFHARAEGGSRLRILAGSPSMSAILGGPRSRYLSNPDALLTQVHIDDRAALIEALVSAIGNRRPLRHRFRITNPDHAKPRHLLMQAIPQPDTDPVEFEGIVLDLTAEAEATEALLEVQRRLQTAQRSESLGLLAGGIAHDFNNLLGAIRANAELAHGSLTPEHPAKARVQRVLDAADRAAGLVRQILAYTGRGTIEVRPIDLAEECRVLRDLLKHALPDSVTISVDAEQGLPSVMFDPAQLQQVLANLIMNAGEAYDGQPGKVEVLVRRHDNNRVRIEVSDHGCGMDAQTQTRMFEPYFTTKKTGHGLGLAAVQGIINAAGATLACRSAPGSGTTFTILLPVTAQRRVAENIETPHPEGGRLILVADDNEFMREAAAQLARELGHTVETVDGGVAAARLLNDPTRRYAAAILDCSMPDRDGTSVVNELRERGSTLPVLLVSGLMDGNKLGTGMLNRRTRFLAKPFSRAMLDRSLRIVLRQSADDESTGGSTFASIKRDDSSHRIPPP